MENYFELDTHTDKAAKKSFLLKGFVSALPVCQGSLLPSPVSVEAGRESLLQVSVGSRHSPVFTNLSSLPASSIPLHFPAREGLTGRASASAWRSSAAREAQLQAVNAVLGAGAAALLPRGSDSGHPPAAGWWLRAPMGLGSTGGTTCCRAVLPQLTPQ